MLRLHHEIKTQPIGPYIAQVAFHVLDLDRYLSLIILFWYIHIVLVHRIKTVCSFRGIVDKKKELKYRH